VSLGLPTEVIREDAYIRSLVRLGFQGVSRWRILRGIQDRFTHAIRRGGRSLPDRELNLSEIVRRIGGLLRVAEADLARRFGDLVSVLLDPSGYGVIRGSDLVGWAVAERPRDDERRELRRRRLTVARAVYARAYAE
jgi:hypothetical protein